MLLLLRRCYCLKKLTTPIITIAIMVMDYSFFTCLDCWLHFFFFREKKIRSFCVCCARSQYSTKLQFSLIALHGSISSFHSVKRTFELFLCEISPFFYCKVFSCLVRHSNVINWKKKSFFSLFSSILSVFKGHFQIFISNFTKTMLNLLIVIKLATSFSI